MRLDLGGGRSVAHVMYVLGLAGYLFKNVQCTVTF